MLRKHIFIRSDQKALIDRDTKAREDVTMSTIVRKALDLYYGLDAKPAKKGKAKR